jgi:competence ComEA-like helix-hairpin-helix protein
MKVMFFLPKISTFFTKTLIVSVLCISPLISGESIASESVTHKTVAVSANTVRAADVTNAVTTGARTAAAKININNADAQTLAERMKGIGLKKAQAIVAYREQHGSFKTLDELDNVKGIGSATLEKNRSLIDIQ